jgi:hypothetical protein
MQPGSLTFLMQQVRPLKSSEEDIASFHRYWLQQIGMRSPQDW